MKSNQSIYSNKKAKTIFIVLLACYGTACLFINFQDQYFNSKYAEKIWIHRVNSIEKLREVNTSFSGIELDIIYDDETNIFDVTHPPAKSIGLTLFNYLSAVELSNENKFWLDFKNLSKINSKNASKKLDSICYAFKLDNKQFIIESTKPQFLNSFSNKAFQTSYYLPKKLCELDPLSLNDTIERIKKNRRSYKTTYLSADKRDYKLIKEHLPESEILTWSFHNEGKFSFNPLSLFRKAIQLKSKHQILSDPKVKIVLYEFKSSSGER